MHRVCRSITRNQVLRLEVVTPQVVQQQATNRRPYNEDSYFVRLDVLVNGECQAVTRNEENTVENPECQSATRRVQTDSIMT